MLVDVYADWCISCKLIEREVFGNPEVQARLRDFTLIRFDMTQSTREQRQWLERQGLFGPPAILFYAVELWVRVGQHRRRNRRRGLSRPTR